MSVDDFIRHSIKVNEAVVNFHLRLTTIMIEECLAWVERRGS